MYDASSRALPNRLSAARLQQIYDRTAAFYDEVVAVHQAAAKQIAIEVLARRAGERVLEVALGTGWAFERLIAASGAEQAYGSEVAPGMIDVARQRLGPGSDGWPALLLSDIRAQPFRDDIFDGLLCTYTLECLPEEMFAPSMDEMLRILRPGGRLVAADLTDGEAEDAAISDEWRRGFAADPEYYGGARPISLVPFFEAAGFADVERRYSGHGAGWPSEIVVGRKSA